VQFDFENGERLRMKIEIERRYEKESTKKKESK